jgi:hypothetical protein
MMSWFAKRRLRRSTSTFRGTCTEAVTLGSVEYGGKGCWLGSCGKYCVLSCTRAIGVHGLPVSPSCILELQLPISPPCTCSLKLQFTSVGARGRGARPAGADPERGPRVPMAGGRVHLSGSRLSHWSDYPVAVRSAPAQAAEADGQPLAGAGTCELPARAHSSRAKRENIVSSWWRRQTERAGSKRPAAWCSDG